MEKIFLVICEVTLPIIMGYIVWLLKEQKKERKANSNGIMLLLRKHLISDHDRFMKQNFIPHYEYQNYIEMYEAYHNLGGNGMVTKMLEDIKELRFKKKENEKQ